MHAIAKMGMTREELLRETGLDDHELVGLEHVACIKRALGISGIRTEEHAWRRVGGETGEGAQIDLLIRRADHAVNICEMKYASEAYAQLFWDDIVDRLCKEGLDLVVHEVQPGEIVECDTVQDLENLEKSLS